MLCALAGGFIWGIRIYRFYQFMRAIGCKFLNSHILTGFLNECFNVFILCFLYIDRKRKTKGVFL